jgi:hypothetical protein
MMLGKPRDAGEASQSRSGRRPARDRSAAPPNTEAEAGTTENGSDAVADAPMHAPAALTDASMIACLPAAAAAGSECSPTEDQDMVAAV